MLLLKYLLELHLPILIRNTGLKILPYGCTDDKVIHFKENYHSIEY